MDSQGHLPDGTPAPKPLAAENSHTKPGRTTIPAKLWPIGMGVLWVRGKTSVGCQTEVPGKTMCLKKPQNIKVNREHWLSPDF